MKTQLRDIKLFDLDSQTVLQISKFVRKARIIDGLTIKLNDPSVIREVVMHGLISKNTEIQALFRSISMSLNAQYDLNIPESLRTVSVETTSMGAAKNHA